MQTWDELRFQGRFENTARLRDGEVPAVAEHVAEPRARDMRIGAPACHLLRVRAEPGAAIRWRGMCRQEWGLDARQVVALAEALEDARRLELALALEVIAGLRLDGGGAAVEPAPEPVGRRLLERVGRGCSRGLDRGHDASAGLRHLLIRRARRAHGDLGHAIPRIHRGGVRVAEPGRHEPAAAGCVVRDLAEQAARLLSLPRAPRDATL